MADDGIKKPSLLTKTKLPGSPVNSLSVFEAQFLSQYLANKGNGKAAIEAISELRGLKATVRANQILKRPIVKYRLEEQLEAQSARILLTADRVLQETMRLATYSIRDTYDENGERIPVHKLPKDVAAAIEGFDIEEIFDPVTKRVKRVFKYRFAKKQGPLQMLAEHLRLVVQKFEVSGPNGTSLNSSKVDLSDVSTALLEKIVAMGEKPQ